MWGFWFAKGLRVCERSSISRQFIPNDSNYCVFAPLGLQVHDANNVLDYYSGKLQIFKHLKPNCTAGAGGVSIYRPIGGTRLIIGPYETTMRAMCELGR